MRFYIAVNEKGLKLEVMVFWDKNIDGDDIIIPEDVTKQPISFPIPKELKAPVTKFIQSAIDERGVLDFFETPPRKRSIKMEEIRKEYNPKIIKKLYEFRNLHAEEFL